MRNITLSGLAGLFGVNATVSHNKIQNGIEVKFSAKPSDEDIYFLKSNRFRWSSRKHLWYATYSESMYKKIEERLANGTSHSEQTHAPAIEPVKELSIEDKAKAALQKFNAILQTNWQMREIFELAQAGIKSFLDNPPESVHFRDRTVELDKKKQQYWHLPLKRKRPDWYSQGDVFSSIINQISGSGGNAGLWNTVKFKIMRHELYSQSSFEYWIKQYPQYFLDPDYPVIKKYYDDLESWDNDEELRWQEWFDKYVTVNTKVYTNTTGGQTWDERLIKGKGTNFRRNLHSTIETETKHGWVTEIGTYDIKYVYDKPNGQSYAELYPNTRPNTFGDMPKINIYVEGGSSVKKETSKPVSEKPKPEAIPVRNLDYFIDYLKNAGIDFKQLTDKLWGKATENLNKIPDNELIFSGTAKQRRQKIIQMGAYKAVNQEPNYELSLDAYSLKVFIRSAFTEANIFDEVLYIPSERAAHLKVLQQAIAEGKTIPDYVLVEYPELRKTAEPETISDEYANFILNEIEERFKEKFPNEKFDRNALVKSWIDRSKDRGIERANAVLEEIFSSYVNPALRAEAYALLRRRFEKRSKPSPAQAPTFDDTKTLTRADIPPAALKVIGKNQIRSIIGSSEHFDIVKRIAEKAEKSRKNQDRKNAKVEKHIKGRADINDLLIVWMHYFYAGSDWFITQWEEDDLYFGYAILNGDYNNAELGYVSRTDLTEDGRVELDFFWKPKPLSECLYNIGKDYFPEPENYYQKLNLDIETGDKLDEATTKPNINLLKMKMKAKALMLTLELEKTK